MNSHCGSTSDNSIGNVEAEVESIKQNGAKSMRYPIVFKSTDGRELLDERLDPAVKSVSLFSSLELPTLSEVKTQLGRGAWLKRFANSGGIPR